MLIIEKSFTLRSSTYKINNYDLNPNTNKNKQFIDHHTKRMAINTFGSVDSVQLSSVQLDATFGLVRGKQKNPLRCIPTFNATISTLDKNIYDS